ncbi:KpsF/GutQ family sugar-phosphate isomerase [Brachymonas sp. J145]|uniref:KpsF/GutQ family sugar-phosphate isomerase n=1 Tax=Brachymonas sp. J145 TaxID=3116489 RepID=UPI002E799B8E|nr:KpsF/GutQ family sugar-phosphate isomerase [Brachymonas sp. J145]MEE1653406.1 KpsF/GutQ family sugar-phosphate isomerase [Brachymonas sp. J145]
MSKIFSQAIEVINAELQALEAMRERMSDSIVKAIEIITSTEGRVVVVGMGKSGIIGQKIAATFASTGTPSFFVHPGEAFHGDLGMIRPVDTALLISNSGETEEVLRILPFLEHQNNKIIAMTGNMSSTLAKHADVVLDVGVTREACNNNLAPTSSTTCTLVMGDVLAVTLSVERNFQPEDFARFHPGGSLGRKLLTRVQDVMHKQLPFVASGSTLNETMIAMTTGRLGVALVTDTTGNLLGLFTDGDLRRALTSTSISLSDAVDNHMTTQPLTISPTERLVEAEEVMHAHKVRFLVVISPDNTPIGLVELFDM